MTSTETISPSPELLSDKIPSRVRVRTGLFLVLLGLFPWSAFLIQAVKHSLPASWKERHEHRDALFLILWAGLVFLFFSASGSKLPPYILPVFPPLALLIGRYLSAAWESRDFPGVRTGYHIYLAVSLLLATVFLAAPTSTDPRLRRIAEVSTGGAFDHVDGELEQTNFPRIVHALYDRAERFVCVFDLPPGAIDHRVDWVAQRVFV